MHSSAHGAQYYISSGSPSSPSANVGGEAAGDEQKNGQIGEITLT